MKKLMYLLIVPLSVLLLSGLGEATVTLSLTPSSQSTTIGGTVILDLEIAGLTDYGPGSLGAFALDISYNPDILSFTSVSFGLSLGDPDWFEADSQPVLAAYCRAVDFHSKISMELDKYLNENEDIIPAKQLYDLQEKNARLMKNLAAGLRLTPQSRYTPKAAATANKKAGGAVKPWSES